MAGTIHPALVNKPVGAAPVMRWWRIKVACGFLLLMGVSLKYLADFAPTYFHNYEALARTLVISGGLLVLYHYFLIKRTYRETDPSSRIVTTGGLFGRVRHPMYLGDIVMYSGLALLACSVVSILVLVVANIALVNQARTEDLLNAVEYPDMYRSWTRTTKLLVPGIY